MNYFVDIIFKSNKNGPHTVHHKLVKFMPQDLLMDSGINQNQFQYMDFCLAARIFWTSMDENYCIS